MKRSVSGFLSIGFVFFFSTSSAFASAAWINEELALPKNQYRSECPIDNRVDEGSFASPSNKDRSKVVGLLTWGVGRRMLQACEKLGVPPKGIRHVKLVCGKDSLKDEAKQCSNKKSGVSPFSAKIKGDTLVIEGKFINCACADSFQSSGLEEILNGLLK